MRPVEEMEVQAAILLLKKTTSPEVDALTVEFYQRFMDPRSVVLS